MSQSLNLDEKYWDNRYQENDDRWDLGEISTPIKTYIDQLENKELKILIPGGGNSHEAEYAFKQGFKNVYVVDLSKTALDNLKKRVPDFPESQLLHQNFFDVSLTFDLIIEQTFFCAINPKLRSDYSKQAHNLLAKNGKIVGLLFNDVLNEDRPPFGGNPEEYKTYFEPYFNIEIMEFCHNSVESRTPRELFFKFLKK